MSRLRIEIEYARPGQRRDVVNTCGNCHAVSASHFIKCPVCGHAPRKIQVIGYVGDFRDPAYPVIALTREELVNRWIPIQKVRELTDEDMIKVSRKIERVLWRDYAEAITRAATEAVDNLTRGGR